MRAIVVVVTLLLRPGEGMVEAVDLHQTTIMV